MNGSTPQPGSEGSGGTPRARRSPDGDQTGLSILGDHADPVSLIEAASLHALGLLDEMETHEFERALAEAPEALRRQVHDQQARALDIGQLLPEVTPPASLKPRVIEEVMREAEEVAKFSAAARAQTHQPGRQAAATGRSPGRSPDRSPGRRSVPRLAGAKRVSAMWRPAAIGMAVAAVVFGAINIQLLREFRNVQHETFVSELLESAGVSHLHGLLFDASTQRLAFTPTDPAVTAEAVIWLNDGWDEMLVFCYQLPQTADAGYELVTLDEDGRVLEVIEPFDADGLVTTVPVRLAAGSVRLGVVARGSNTVLLTAEVSV